MYICNSCGGLFEEPKIIVEHHPYGDSYATEEWAVCPYCEDNNFEEANRCSICDEYAIELTDGMCNKCYEETEV